MIILSGVLVVVAIALLVAGIVAGNGDSAQVFGLDALVVIYISIAVSIVSAVCLAIGVFLRRKELFGQGASQTPARGAGRSKKAKKDKRGKGTPAGPPAPAANAQGAPEAKAPAADPDDEVEIPAPAVDVPDDAVVFVVRGRKRYHLDTCRQLAGRETEELTYAEAKEEGFSPCTACMPDTALAARAAASGPASPDAGKAAGGPSPIREPGLERSEGGLAGLAKPAPRPAPASFDEPGPFDRPSAFDRTDEIPRADGPGAEDAPQPDAPKRGPAGPTLTDMPVAGLFASGKTAEEAPKATETAEPADTEGEGHSAPQWSAEAESAPPDVTADLGPAPLGIADAPSPAPRPRDADDEDAPEPEPAGETEAASGPAEEPDDDGPQVRILSGTKRYHRTDCALIEDIGDEADDLESLSRAEAKSRGCTPCLVCQPDREHARD
ncbi:hypothetical protein E1293_43465 [Actinomadura darangshiensis]|uniref:Uncharacterized protein n=1 Tax=Actinomadura darangshiensis TaxID=705336 RepID=A0A4R4ZVD9_9ACTN|nr:hypothetical protein [Actinomadura darangshiensis]TDD63133.1 hypothetical protein E1293_43465 [Actinomadura darangshiensis]